MGVGFARACSSACLREMEEDELSPPVGPGGAARLSEISTPPSCGGGIIGRSSEEEEASAPQPHGEARVKAGQAARSRRAQRLRSLVAQAKRKKWALLEGDALARMDARVFKTYFEPALVEENVAAARN